MNREDFIKKLQAEGFALNGTSLRSGLMTISINEDGTVSTSSPAGRGEYNSYDDYIIGKAYSFDSYGRLD